MCLFSPHWTVFHYMTFSWWPPPLRSAHPVPLKKTKHKFINLVEEWFWLQSLKAILLGDAKVLTKYTAPKLPWPISLRSEKSFSGSSLKKRSAIPGSFRLPVRAALGMLGGGGAAATSHYLGLRHDSPHWWLICKTVASYGPTPDRERECSIALE